MSQHFNPWHYSLVTIISGLILFVLGNKDLALALSAIGSIYSFAMLPIVVLEVGFVWLVLKYSKDGNSILTRQKNVLYVVAIIVILGLVLVINFTNSFVEDALKALLLSFAAIYFILLGLLLYRDYISSLSQNE